MDTSQFLSLISSTILSILLVTLFSVSYYELSNSEIESFTHCTSQLACLFELIEDTQTPELCELHDNSQYCYLRYAFFSDSHKLCLKTNEPLECIYTFSINDKTNYCNTLINEDDILRCKQNFNLFLQEYNNS